VDLETGRESYASGSWAEAFDSLSREDQVTSLGPDDPRDALAADCLWEAESLDALRDYLDPATRGFCQNTYFEVDSNSAMGLPLPASAGITG
jgi:hypothetical protein